MKNIIIGFLFLTSSVCFSAPWDDWGIDEILGNEVTITVNYSLKYDVCKKSHPLIVTIKNGTRKIVTNVVFEKHVMQEGFSSNLVKMTGWGRVGFPDLDVPRGETDKIMEPDSEYIFCSAIPELRKEYNNNDDFHKYNYVFKISDTTDDNGKVRYY